MRRILFLVALLSPAAVATAQLSRTAVSVNGVDTNPCSPALPCRSFSQALMHTSTGGEVIVLDSGGYGVAYITQSVSIDAAPGIYAGVSALPGYNALSVSLSTAGKVTLRGLTLKGFGANDGILANAAGGILHVENCHIDGGFLFDGISCDSNLVVQDTVINSVGVGIRVGNPSANASGAIDSVILHDISGTAVLADYSGKISARNTVADTGAHNGFGTSQTAEMNLENCAAMNFQYGVANYYTSTIRISNSFLTDNVDGIVRAGGPVESWQNNNVRGNMVDISGSITNLSQN